MLEIRNLTKIYRSKTGDSVRALDGVNISFPETGMVFILGKSGSGKSTLLNVMGGLDSYDEGEFIIKGKSSKDFAGSDFDAYRNTFIGFIFQEYNVLDDFTVGANIGLALELQGKKATDEKINDILGKVDLLNYAKRKPNELSGGQKQRVAIARALVKDPQIIMADEPTGALDSNTGKQIFDTLKELSREKLVLIVSHDRDFAERYADRIVELADGKIISDVTKHEKKSVQLSDGIQQINDQILRIKGGYRLTERDLQMINDYLSRNHSDIILSGDGRINDELRSAAGISAEGNTAVFEGTDTSSDYQLKSYTKEDSRFIRSRLPAKNALRIGASGLKHKKFRLVMTIFLSLIAFALFGFADTLGAYEKEQAAVSSLMDANIKTASVTLGVKHTFIYDGEEPQSYYQDSLLNEQDIETLKQQTGLDFIPVYTGGDRWNGGFAVANHFKSYQNNQVYQGSISGLVSLDQATLNATGMTITGRLPEAPGEIAITELLLRQFNEYGFVNNEYEEVAEAGTILSADVILGKHIAISSRHSPMNEQNYYTIVGVIDTHFDYNRYQSLLPNDDPSLQNQDGGLGEMVLLQEVETELSYGFHMLGFAHKDDIEEISKNSFFKMQELGTYMTSWGNSETYIVISQNGEVSEDEKEAIGQYMTQIRRLAGSDVLSKVNVKWLDGQERTTLAPNEVVIPQQMLDSLLPQTIERTFDVAAFGEKVNEIYGAGAWESTDASIDLNQRLHQAAGDEGVSMEVYRELIPLIAEFYGISELPDNLPDEACWRFTDRLSNISENSPTLNLERYQIEELIHFTWACDAVYSQRLWENDDMIDLFMASNYFDNPQLEWEQYPESRPSYMLNFYQHYYLYQEGNEKNPYGLSYSEIRQLANQTFFSLMGDLDISNLFKFERILMNHENASTSTLQTYDLTVVGTFESMNSNDMIINDVLLADYLAWEAEERKNFGNSYQEIIADHEDGIYAFAVAPVSDEESVRKLVQLTYDEDSDLRFSLQNAVMNTLGNFNDFIEVGAVIFLYVGIGFAVFSALLLMNFISTSISYKKREIGILRAVGAKSSDVFKIFFSEALIIALINFILSLAAVIAAIIVTNRLMHAEGINITLLTFGPRQVILMLLISVFVALLASFLPVYSIAKRKPVDAIKNL